MIDHEDLFISSLDYKLLDKKVKDYKYEDQDWTTKKVMVINLK